MFDGDRSNISTIVGIIFVALITCFSGAFIWDLSALNNQYSKYADTAFTEYANSTNQRIESTCIDRDLSAFSNCVSEILESTRESQRAAYELEAQQSMAKSALRMLFLSAGALPLTGIGVWFVWKTLLATQESVLETRRISEAQTTPFLTISIEDGNHVKACGDAWVFEHPQKDIFFRLQNSGSSPAIVTRLFRCWDFTPECKGQPAPIDPDAVPNGYGLMKSNSVAIGGNAKSTKIHTFFDDDNLHSKTHERRAHRSHFMGFVDYESVGGDKFRLGFCCILHHGYLELDWPSQNAEKYNYNKKLGT